MKRLHGGRLGCRPIFLLLLLLAESFSFTTSSGTADRHALHRCLTSGLRYSTTRMPKVEINDREMVVRFEDTSRTYTLV